MCYFLRFSLLLFCLFLLKPEGYAQILVGPTLGVEYGGVSFDDEILTDFYSSQPAFSFSGGASVIFKVRERFFLNTELLYTRRHDVINGKKDFMLRDELTSSFIELPLTYQMHFENHIHNLKYNLYVGAGPNIGYWLGSHGQVNNSELFENGRNPIRYQIVYGTLEDESTQDVVYVEDANRVQLGLNLAAGMTFEPQAGSRIITEARFLYGHSRMAQTGYGVIPNLVEYQRPLATRYTALRITVAYVIDTNISERKKGKSTFKQP